MGRPGLAPGIYFRLLLIGYFEGIDSERGIAWRAADSLSLREFLGCGAMEEPPDHSTVSRTRRLIDVETHQEVFRWVLGVLAGGVCSRARRSEWTPPHSKPTPRCAASCGATRARVSGVSDRLGPRRGHRDADARATGAAGPEAEEEGLNKEWQHPHDPDARITKMKDGRTHLAHKAEHAVDMETGAIVAVTLQAADQGDTTTIGDTAIAAAEQTEDAQADVEDCAATIRSAG